MSICLCICFIRMGAILSNPHVSSVEALLPARFGRGELGVRESQPKSTGFRGLEKKIVGEMDDLLVGGLEHDWIMTFHNIWEESSQLTFIFFRGVETTSQMNMIYRDKIDDNDTSLVANNLGQNPEEVRVFLLFPTGFPTTFRYISVVSGLFSHGVRITLLHSGVSPHIVGGFCIPEGFAMLRMCCIL